MEWGNGRRRYTSPVNMAARQAAQLLLLKPAVWGLLTVQVHGREHCDGLGEQAFVVIANHSSHFDAPLVIGALPPRLGRRLSTGAAADYFFKHWHTAAATELFFNAFPVDRTGTRNRRGMANTLLSEGVPLLLFPEGTRSRNGGMGTFKPGSAALCISHDVPALPIALVGAFAAWPARQARWKSGRPPVHVVFGSPMRPHPGEIAHQFNERLRRRVIELHDGIARAYAMPTQAEMMRLAAIERVASTEVERPDPEAGNKTGGKGS